MHTFKSYNTANVTKFVIGNNEQTPKTAYLDGCISNVEVYINDACDDTFISAHMKYLSDFYAIPDNPYN